MDNDPLNLRNLPNPAPPENLWSAIAADLDAAGAGNRQRPAWLPKRWIPIAAAASLAAVIAGVNLVDTTTDHPGDPVDAGFALAQARVESAGLERLLRRQRDGVLDASSVESLAWMEHELGWLDLQLAHSPEDARLWQQRVELLEQMTRQYERNSWQAGIQLASY